MTQQSKDEQIGIHKGSLSALAKEREGLSAILSIVEQQMQAHVKSLKEVGIIKFLKAENKGKENRRIYFTMN